MTASRLQQALADRQTVWGGWVVGPTILGPEEFAAAGYDYVGFDVQHGYLDDADVALLLRRLEHVPIATAVRLPSPDPAPIGRVLDAGADAVIIAMVETPEQAAAALAATRYAPEGVRSFGPLRASLGHDTVALQERASVIAMIETRHRRCGSAGYRRGGRPDGSLCRTCRPGDLDGKPTHRRLDTSRRPRGVRDRAAGRRRGRAGRRDTRRDRTRR